MQNLVQSEKLKNDQKCKKSANLQKNRLPSPPPGRVNLVRHRGGGLFLPLEHFLDEGGEQVAQVPLSVEAKTVGHDLAGQTVASEQRLHAVCNLHL